MTSPRFAVLVMAYGTPKSLDDVEAYYTHIRRGNPPSRELLDELIGRYQAIGGVSPLGEITKAQGEGILNALNRDGGRKARLYFGMKHAEPFIADAVKQMVEDGIEEAVSIVLTPHYSTLSVASYQKQALETAEQLGGPTIWPVNEWHMHPRFLRLLASRVNDALNAFEHPDDVMVIFTAHSLPERILRAGDPYVRQLHESGDAVAEALGLKNYMYAWQSAGRTTERWLGPDISDVLHGLAKDGVKDVVICPQGFVSDHLEVLYDVDIECQQLARELGIRLVRTKSLNADPLFVQALAEVVRDREQKGVDERG
jgi:protoporphyrin/coproporphyrin ferrochelatase